MSKEIFVLIVDDSDDDAVLMARALEKDGLPPHWKRVDTAASMEKALKGRSWDVILCDYSMPNFGGNEALQLYNRLGLDTPFIIVSGNIGEATAVNLMKAGAHDYVRKGSLAHLAVCVEREIKEAANRAERRKMEEELRDNETKYRLLFENMRQGAFRQKADGKLIDVNPAALDMFGLTKDEFLNRSSGDPEWDVIHEDGSPYPGNEHPSLRAIENGKPVIGEVAGILNKRTNRRVWMEINAIPEFQPGKKRPYQVLMTLHDITERKRADEETKARLMLKARAELTGFMLSALPVFGSLISIELKNTLMKRFSEQFENNVRPGFEINMATFQDNTKSPDILFKRYIDWFRAWLSNIGIPTRFEVQADIPQLVFLDCPWKKVSGNNPIFCLLCRGMVIRSFSWTDLKGEATHICVQADGSPTCVFAFKLPFKPISIN
jgi:PAS domain S-box-containing protein